MKQVVQEVFSHWLQGVIGEQSFFLMAFLALSLWFLHHAGKERARPGYAVLLAGVGITILVWILAADLSEASLWKCGLIVMVGYLIAVFIPGTSEQGGAGVAQKGGAVWGKQI